MGLGEFIAGFFTQVWRIFSMPSGLFGLTFADIALGSFVVVLVISIVKSVFGLGTAAYQKTTGGTIAMVKRYSAKNKARKEGKK